MVLALQHNLVKQCHVFTNRISDVFLCAVSEFEAKFRSLVTSTKSSEQTCEVCVYLWPRRSRTEAELCLDGRHRLHPDGWPLVLGAGGDDAVGGGPGRGLPLEELQDGLDVCGHLGLQSDHQTAAHEIKEEKKRRCFSSTLTDCNNYDNITDPVLHFFFYCCCCCDLISPQGSSISAHHHHHHLTVCSLTGLMTNIIFCPTSVHIKKVFTDSTDNRFYMWVQWSVCPSLCDGGGVVNTNTDH